MAYTGPLGRAFLRRGGPGYESDWYGDAIVNSVADAARSAITEVVRGIAEDIRNEHPNWDHKTHQLHDAVFSKPAIIEWSTHQPGAPHVWGEAGILDSPRWRTTEEDEEAPHWTRDPHTGQFRLLTNMDVAMFLEFGTARMEPKTPWLYDAWDRNVVKLPALIKEYTLRNQAGGTPFAIRNHLGQFAPHEGP